MSDRPTPETDALERCQRIQRLQPARDPRFWHGDRLDQMRNLACKLERERDEARQLVDWIIANAGQAKRKEGGAQ